MSQNAVLTWVDPSGPLTGVEIAVATDGTNFTVAGTASPGAQTFSVPDLADGSYTFKATSLNGSARSGGVSTTGTVVSPPVVPGDVSNLAVSFS